MYQFVKDTVHRTLKEEKRLFGHPITLSLLGQKPNGASHWPRKLQLPLLVQYSWLSVDFLTTETISIFTHDNQR